jgi:hypothetical protein
LKLLIDSDELRRDLGAQGPSRAQELCSPPGQLRKVRDLLTTLKERGRYVERR